MLVGRGRGAQRKSAREIMDIVPVCFVFIGVPSERLELLAYRVDVENIAGKVGTCLPVVIDNRYQVSELVMARQT